MTTARLTLAALAVLIPSAAQAQRVVADLRVHEGPVAGHVVVGDVHGRRTFVEPRHSQRPFYRPVTVIRVRRGEGWYRHHGFRTVQLWYDADRNCYYDRRDGDRVGLRAVVVYEQGGRYYRNVGWRDGDRHWRDRDDRDRDDRD